jgi:hypothetical protein
VIFLEDKINYTNSEKKLLKSNPKLIGARRKLKQLIQEDIETKVYL